MQFGKKHFKEIKKEKLIKALKKLKPKEKIPLHGDRAPMKLEPEKDFIKLNAGKNVLKSNVNEEYINK